MGKKDYNVSLYLSFIGKNGDKVNIRENRKYKAENEEQVIKKIKRSMRILHKLEDLHYELIDYTIKEVVR